MSLFVESELLARRAKKKIQESAGATLEKRAQAMNARTSFDIFLSHAAVDQRLVLEIVEILETTGYTVYVDWIQDQQLDREKVTKNTAEMLRTRMRQSKALFFLTTVASAQSKWMPWELGYKDGHDGKVAIVPIASSSTDQYIGQEYLGIYPYVTQENDTKKVPRIWIRHSKEKYEWFDTWVRGR